MAGTWWVLAFALAPVPTAVVAVVAWRRRGDNPAARALALTLAGISIWSLAAALITADLPPSVRALGYPLMLLAVGASMVGLSAVSRLLADPGWRPRQRTVLLLAVEPVVLAVLSVLPSTADLVYGRTDLTAPGTVHLVGGPLFAAHAVYCYGIVLLGLVRLARTARTGPRVVRRQAALLLAAAVPPTVGNVVVTAGMGGDGAVDLTPLFFVVSGLMAGWAILRLGLLDLVPVARHQVVETMTDAVLVTDATGRVVDLNPAAARLLARLRPDDGTTLLGRSLGEFAGPDVVAAVLPGTVDSGASGHAVLEVAAGCWLDVRSIPVGSGGGSTGRLTVVRDVSESQRRETDLRRLNEQLADQVETIEQLRATLAEEAVRDPLTGLHNRRHLDRALADAIRCATVDGLPVAVLALDIDRFKTVNDRFGHAVGDDVLTAVAAELRSAVRAGDTLARAGGEEFVLVLPGAGEAEALARAQTIRRLCADLRHAVPGGTLTVTVSTGVCVGLAGGPGADALLIGADRALYRAKGAGRDRVVSAGCLGPDVQDVLSRV